MTLIIDHLSHHIHNDPDDPDVYVQRAHAYVLVGENSLARDDVETALRLDPANEMALLLRGTMHFDDFRFAEALADLNLLIERHPGQRDGQFYRALVLLQTGVEPDRIVGEIQRSSDSPAAEPRCHYAQAALAFRQKDFKGALFHTDMGLALEPDDHVTRGNLWQVRARALAELHMAQEAAEAFDTAVSLLPESAYLRAAAAAHRFHIAEWADALRLIDGSLSIQRSDDASALRAEILHASGDLEGAISTLTEAASRSPGRTDLWTAAGNMLRLNERWDRALDICSMMSRHPESASLALIEEAEVQRMTGNTEHALELLDAVISDPTATHRDLADLRHTRITETREETPAEGDWMFVRIGDGSDAVSVRIGTAAPVVARGLDEMDIAGFEEDPDSVDSRYMTRLNGAIKKDPKSIPILLRRAKCHLNRLDFRLAERDARRALAIRPKSRLGAAILAAAVSSNPTSVRRPDDLRRLIENYPEFDEPYVRLASIIASRGDAEGALDILRGGLESVPASTRIHDILALYCIGQKDYQAAIGHYNSIISIGKPHHRNRAFLARASAKHMLGDHAGALADRRNYHGSRTEEQWVDEKIAKRLLDQVNSAIEEGKCQ